MFGEDCNICGAKRLPGQRRLARDHDHKTGQARGILCIRCNRAIPNWMTSDWLRLAADYLDRAEAVNNSIEVANRTDGDIR